MKYLKKFQTETEYQEYKNGDEYITPNLSGIVYKDQIKYNKYVNPTKTFTIINNVYTGTGSFTEVKLKFDEGMTWVDFMNSQYNTVGIFDAYADNGAHIEIFSQSYILGTSSGVSDVKPTDKIIANKTYYVNVWSCFVAGTQVLTSLDGETKNIEDMSIGDDVISYDIVNNENYKTSVTHTYKHSSAYNMAKITCDDGTVLEMSESHPLYTKDGWKSLTNYKGYPTLCVGDIVKTIDDWSEITSIERYTLDEPTTVYTLNVKDINEEIDIDTNDNYYANGVLAHNKASK